MVVGEGGRTSRAGRRRKMVVVLLVWLASIAVLEGALRALVGNLGITGLYEIAPGDGRCVGLRPGAEVSYTGIFLRTPPVRQEVNSLGYRGPARPPGPSQQGVLRIAAVGDSYTYGQGVAAEEALPSQLEKALGDRLGTAVEVLNFGVPGYNLDEALEQHARFSHRWGPDVVLFLLFDNDLDRPMCDQVGSDSVGWWIRNVYVSRLVLLPYLAWPDETRRNAEELRRGMLKFDRVVRDTGGRLAVAVLNDPLRGEAGSVLDPLGIPWTEASVDGLPRIPREGHLSAEGNRILAERVAEWLASVLASDVAVAD